MKKCLLITLTASILSGIVGCATDSSAPTAATSTAAAKPGPKHEEKPAEMLLPAAKVNAIAKGMKAETVRELLGAPNRVAPFASGTVTGEVWTYRISVSEAVDQVPTSMKEVSAWDPINNRPMTIREPVYQIQHTRVFQTLELLIVDGRLLERKGGRDVDRSFY